MTLTGLGEKMPTFQAMNILYISQYFPPEIGATQTRAYEMAINLVAMGHRVTMMTEVPNHPSGIIPLEYRSRFRVIEEMDGIHVVRSWVYATPIKSFRTRMLFYLSFIFFPRLFLLVIPGLLFLTFSWPDPPDILQLLFFSDPTPPRANPVFSLFPPPPI